MVEVAITHSWTPGSSTLASAANLSTGIYTVSYSDNSNNCRGVNTFSLTSYTLNTVFYPQSPTCINLANGSASITATGGLGPYTFTWLPSSVVSNSLSNVAAGPYTVQILDITTQCTKTSSIYIYPPTPVNLSAVAINSNLCIGATATISCAASGGSPSYLYNWSNGSSNQTQYINLTQTGTYVYSVVAIDANNCPASATVAIQYNANPTISATSASVCSGKSYTLFASGANSYTWQPGNLASSQLTGTAVSNVIYTITGRTGNCFDKVNANLVTLPLLLVFISAPNELCAGQVMTISTLPANSYTWSGPGNFTSSVREPTLLTLPALSGFYSLTVSGTNGCTNTTIRNILINPLPTVTISGPQQFCAGDFVTFTATGADNYYWPYSSATQPTMSFFATNITSLSVVGITNNTYCESTASISFNVNKCLSVVSQEQEGFKLYPNPFLLSFQVEVEQDTRYDLYSFDGMMLQQGVWTKGRHNMQLTDIPEGIYLLRTYANDNLRCYKLIKGH